MKFFVTLCAICFSAVVMAQNCNSKLSGTIDDFHDGSKIIGASLYIESLDVYAVTDLNGDFKFSKLCDGNYNIKVSHIACETKILNIEVKGNTVYNITLEHHVEELELVNVKGSAIKTQTHSSQETVLKSKDLETYSSGSLGDALKQISGVNSLNTGNTIVKPVINGLHSSRIIVMTNGVRLQDQEWGIEHAPNIDINSAETISVIKGSGALAFGGDALGGVVVMSPQRVFLKDSLFGKTIATTQNNGRGFSLSSKLTKTYTEGWYVSGQGTLKKYGDFKAPNYSLTNTGLNSNGFSIHAGFKTFEQGFNVFYSYLNNEIAILRSSHIGNIEDLVNAINSQQPSIVEDFSYDINAPRQDVTHQIFKAEFYKRFKKFGRLEIQYDFQNNQRFEYDIRVGDDRDKAAIDLKLKTHSIKTALKLDSNHGNTYEIGLSANYQNNFANPNTGVRRLIPDYDKYDFGIYAITDITINDNLRLDFGVRYDFNYYDAQKFYLTSRWEERGYDVDFADLVIDDLGTQLLVNPKFKYHNISASAGTTYKINDEHSILFNYSLSNRAPNPSELFSDGLHHSAARIELGDLRIDQETSNRFALSYLFSSEKLIVNIETFYNHITDFIYIEPTGTEQTLRGAFPVWSYKQTNASLIGLDFSLDYNISKDWSFKNRSSVLRGRNLELNRPLIDMPSNKTVNSFQYSNKKWLNFNASIESELVLRQNDFPNNNFEAFIPTTNETVLVDISTPPPTYHLLHFNSDITFALNHKTNLNVGLSVQNVLNTSYRNYLNRLRYFADDLGRNIMLQLKLNY
ncbi:TonB-dependent receptor [Psychroserpens damuponensis]|uniref:TonB-dependent receptor n=1 Tax=Psychroserpens damuponensis TaxID=943936 RepID=UPI00058DCB6C|nr:TonB-dependent receptor [Psychroserpens damuponensis]